MSRTAPRWRAFWATTVKEWQVVRRYPAELVMPAVWAVLVPAVYVAQAAGFAGGDAAAMAAFVSRGGSTDVAAYIYLGWSVHLWLTIMLWGPGMALRDEKVRGSLETTMLTRASRASMLFGQAPAYLVPALGVFVVCGLVLGLFTTTPPAADRLLVAALVLLVSILPVIALSGLFATVAVRFQDSAGLVELVRGLFVLLCGVTYPLSVLPGWARAVGEWLPPTVVIDALRVAVLTPTGVAGLAGRLGWLVCAAVVLGAVAVHALGRGLAASRRTGDLGRF